jgi:hypothetical protein
MMNDYYEAHLAPGLAAPEAQPAGLGACPIEISVIAEGLGFEAQASQIGRRSFSQVRADLERFGPHFSGCRDRDFVECLTHHDLGAIPRIVAFSKVMTLLGIEANPSPLDRMMERCARFEVQFHGEICTDESDSCDHGIDYSFTSDRITFTVPLAPTGLLGAGPLKQGHTAYNDPRCPGSTMSSGGSTLQVFYGALDLNNFSSRGRSASAPIELYIHPGIPVEHLHLNCFGGGDEIDTLWWRKWCSFHQKEIIPVPPDPGGYCLGTDQDIYTFYIPRWVWEQKAPYRWELDIEETAKQAGLNELGFEDTDIQLIHRPQ